MTYQRDFSQRDSSQQNSSLMADKPELKGFLRPDFATGQFNQLLVKPVNWLQMFLAESYLNGLVIPDQLCLKMLRSSTTFFYENLSS